MKKEDSAFKDLQTLPNVGPRVAEDLLSLGIFTIEDLKNKDPQKLYSRLEKRAGTHVDRCMLYVLRSLVYMAQTGKRGMKEVAWWHFKDVTK